MPAQYICENRRRRQAVLANPALNGLDFLDVLDQQAPAGSPPQQTLLVHLFQPASALTVQNLRIEGGTRVSPVNAVWIFPASSVPAPPANAAERAFFASLPNADHILVVRTDSAGDFSTYTLRVVSSPTDAEPPSNFDVQFAALDFSFKVECPSDFDCQPTAVCPPESIPAAPPIDYLAKDYSSFRTLMLDRMSVTMPAWQEQNPADLGVALVELLAYAGDHLSYYQDAVATEAYLGTARRRTSVRRHVRLLDYAMHDGVNARAWVHIEVASGSSADGLTLPGPSAGRKTQMLTQVNAPRGAFPLDQVQTASTQGAVVFETLHDVTLHAANNQMQFYTWGDDSCCLPKGATEATLLSQGDGGPIQLAVGDAVLFEEVIGPATGAAADADPAHRWVVRLTAPPKPSTDPLNNTAVVEIGWGAEDALPFPLCLSTTTSSGLKLAVSVARANLVLADHGATVAGETMEFTPGRFRPRLQNTGITFATPFDSARAASAAVVQDPRAAAPAVILSDTNQVKWTPLRDLLSAGPFDLNFVVETEDDGTATLRFGDGILGAAPNAGFTANYRIGNGSAGHVGAEAIAHVVTNVSGIKNVRNPLPSQGGIDPEPDDEVRLNAPQAFRTQQRAVTEQDYADAAGRHPEVEKAEATLRFTGTWHTMFVTVQRRGGQPVNDAFRATIRDFLEPLRLAGFDLEVEAPIFAPLDIAFTVYVAPAYFQGDVEEALLETFSNRDLPDGRRGFFHPDNFTFGQPVYLSRIVAAAMQVPGVLWLDTTAYAPNRFQRFGETPHGELLAGRIEMARLEIARLDNDPNEAENGRLEFFMEGGA
ncbi:MAG: putative baseplate assembly protein [Deltaproteobacteria bacterium]|nr:putative baseplate assembly protein [Deltaproteobacteria bacterium]